MADLPLSVGQLFIGPGKQIHVVAEIIAEVSDDRIRAWHAKTTDGRRWQVSRLETTTADDVRFGGSPLHS